MARKKPDLYRSHVEGPSMLSKRLGREENELRHA